ncbi:hypothetical protein QFC21_005846 [Naganishia friedmannii]|uniref:Uncharacterized protein n=1 Tax=Naganishia friedmannii TaxID=89922 RepID=A0ACC2V5Q0_9TREE|nr:hypothetical protein QFC21_005846 [Naganishia friedmannii]
MSSSQPPSSAKSAEFPQPEASSSTLTNRPKPKGPSAKRKRIIEERIVTEPIQPIRPMPDVGSSNGVAGPDSASASGQNSYAAPSESVKTSTRTRSRRSAAGIAIGSASYSSDVVPITPAAVDRKEKFPVTQRTLEVAGKIAELGEVQQIKCFACAESEAKRVAALEDFMNRQSMGVAPEISDEARDKLLSPVVCFYYDPAKLGIIKGVRMSNTNYGRCSNCMTVGCGCWWPTESLAPGLQAATAKALSTATASSSLAGIVKAGSNLTAAESSSRSSRRPDSQRSQKPAKPRRATVKRKPVVTADAGSMMVIESEPINRANVRFQEPQAVASPEPAPANAQPISPVPQPVVFAPRSPSPVPVPQAAPLQEPFPLDADQPRPQLGEDSQQPEQDPLPAVDQASNPSAARTEEEKEKMLQAALAYMLHETEANEEEYDGEFPLQHVPLAEAVQDVAPGLPDISDSGVDLSSGAEVQNGVAASVPIIDESQGAAMEVDEEQDQPDVTDQDQPLNQQEDVQSLPRRRTQSPSPPAIASPVPDSNSVSMTAAIQQEASVEETQDQTDDANEAIRASPGDDGLEHRPLATTTHDHDSDKNVSENQSPASVNHSAGMNASEDEPTVTMDHASETNAPENKSTGTTTHKTKASASRSSTPAAADADNGIEESAAHLLESPGSGPSLDSPVINEPAQQSAETREDIQLVSHDRIDADDDNTPIHTASTNKSIEDEYSFLFAAQEDGVTAAQEETVVLGVQSSDPDEEVALNDEMVVEADEEEQAMNNGEVFKDGAGELASKDTKTLLAVKEEEMAMNDGGADDDHSEDADMDDGQPSAAPSEDVDMNGGEVSMDPPDDKAVGHGDSLDSPINNEAVHDGDALQQSAEDEQHHESAGPAVTAPEIRMEIIIEEELPNALPVQHEEEQEQQQFPDAPPSPSTVNEEPLDYVPETQHDPVPEATPATPIAVAELLAEVPPPITVEDGIQVIVESKVRQGNELVGEVVEKEVVMVGEVAEKVVKDGETEKEAVMVDEAVGKKAVILDQGVGQAVEPQEAEPQAEQEVAMLGSQIAAAETRSPVTPTGRTRSTRSTRAAAKAIKKYSSSTNKNKGSAANGGHGSTFGIPSAPPEFQLTPKWIQRLPFIPKADIIIQDTSVPLKQDNRNLMSLDIPGVNKAFRKCTGCTLRECPCAPLPIDPDKRETDHTKYWQNSVLDSAGCLTCRVCGVICSFQLDPPIYGDYSTLPSPRTLDTMKLLPEDWDTRSALDGFDGEEEVDQNGANQSAGESRPPSHPDPTFLQSNKCSGCALRQCPCIALPAGEGRGGGCIKCKECNVACSFNVATPQPDGKLVVWANADSTVTGGRERAGNDSKRVTTLGKRKLLAVASDEEDGTEHMENGHLDG